MVGYAVWSRHKVTLNISGRCSCIEVNILEGLEGT
jgi:hypothetical protein